MVTRQQADFEISAEFGRKVWALLGLPFDAVSMDEAVSMVIQSVEQKSPLFISTPNLNFVIGCRKDPGFRDSVIHSDLSIADGMPLIWVSGLMGIPIKERVAGSSLVDRLRETPDLRTKPIKVFFFGGDEGVAEIACQKLAEGQGGLVGVGSYYPGFGSVDEMSTDEVINQINRSGADFVIVALGAKKGQEWIERNRSRLDAPVISHLGAVVNFVAGTTKRAPHKWQRLGLEWVWRILEEPALWKRYWGDGLTFLQLLATRILPGVLSRLFGRKSKVDAEPVLLNVRQESEELLVGLEGVVNIGNLRDLQDRLAPCLVEEVSVLRLDLEKLSGVDPSFIGFLFVLRKRFGRNLKLDKVSGTLSKALKYSCAEFLLD